MRLRAVVPCAFALLWLAPSCGSDEAAKPAPRPEGDELRQELLGKCRAFAERLCASAGPCCERHGEFSAERCVDDYVTNVCADAASVVAEGLATYDESAQEACFSVREAIFQTCEGDWEEVVAAREAVWTHCKVVGGTRKPGETCGAWPMCERPEGAAGVDCVGGVCVVIRHLAEGEPCEYVRPEIPVCGPGLYCTAADKGLFGTCERATAEGGACNPVLQNPACGLGYYCDQDAAVCRKATNFGGPSCVQGTECVGFVCDRETGDCLDAAPLASSFCGKMNP
jgi:hypothetical protein